MLENRKGILKPFAIAKMPNSGFNRVLMKIKEIKKIWHDKERLDMVLQQYIFPKGRKACKVRLIYDLEKVKIFIVSNSFRLDGKADADPYKTQTEGMRSNTANTTHIAKTADTETNKVMNISEDYSKTQWSYIDDGYNRSDKEDRDSSFIRKETYKSNGFTKLDTKTGLAEIDCSENEAEMRQTKHSKRGKVYRTSSRIFEKSGSINDPTAELEHYFMNITSSPKPGKFHTHSANITKMEDEEPEDVKLSFGMLKKLRQLYCTDLTRLDHVNIYESKNLKLFTTIIQETKRLMVYIDKFTLKQGKVKLNRAVCDFCEDKDGNWWFLKLKSVKFGPAKEKKKLMIKTHKFECPGDYCKVTVGFEAKEDNCNIFKVSPRIVKPHSRKVFRRILEIHKSHSPGNIIDLLDPKQYDEVKVCKNCYFVYNEQSKKKEIEPDKVRHIAKQKRYDKIIKEIDPETLALPAAHIHTQDARLTTLVKSRALSVSKLQVKNPSPFFKNILDSSYVKKRKKVQMPIEKVPNFLSHKKAEIDVINSQLDKKLISRMKTNYSFTSL